MNCLTEIFVERALARAAELDAYLKATGKVAGPLHGLPISLKDQFRLKGLETTMGKRIYKCAYRLCLLSWVEVTFPGSESTPKRIPPLFKFYTMQQLSLSFKRTYHKHSW